MEYDQVENIVMSCEDIAKVLQLSPKYISELVREHEFPKATYNQYPLVDFIQKYISYQEEKHKKEVKKIRNEMSEAKPRFDMAAARLKELELEEKEGSLVPITDVKKYSLDRAIIYSKSLDALSTKLPPLLDKLTVEQMYEVIKKETDYIRNQVADVTPDIPADQIEFD